MRPKFLSRGSPLVRVRPKDLIASATRRRSTPKAVKAFDLYTLGRRPHDLFGWLAATEQ
jgi:hypothetical protein